jgi:NDP-sugar pyrophosphorylase family protein
MVLAAGHGTRLWPLTEELPKPAVPVLGAPLIEHTLRFLRSHGIREVVVNLHHLPEAIPAAVGDGSRLGMRVEFIVEHEIRGTGGGVLGARDFLDTGETFLVVNGDVLLEPDLHAALQLHGASDAVATMVVRRHPRAREYGAIEVDHEGRARRIPGAPEVRGVTLEATMFTGLHLLEPAIFDLLPEKGCIVRTAYRALLEAGEVVCASVDTGPWVELGTVRDYLEANLALASGELRFGHVPAGAGSWIADDAEVRDPSFVTAPVVVGARARVRAPIERVVVWQGATVGSPTRNAVVTPRRVVAVD